MGSRNLKSISGSLVNFDITVEEIGPEDLNWSTELCCNNVLDHDNKCNRQHVSENEPGIEKSVRLDDTQYSNISMVNNFVYRSREHCDSSESTFKIDKEIGIKELQINENKCSETTLKCLYQGGKILNCGDGTIKDQRSIICLENDILEIPESGINHIENSPAVYQKIGFNSPPWDSCIEEKPILHAETISLIRNGIIGEFSAEEPAFSNDEKYYDQDQIVPTGSNVCKNDYPVSTIGQYSNNYGPENKITKEKGNKILTENGSLQQWIDARSYQNNLKEGKQLKDKKVTQDEQLKSKRKKVLADFSSTELCVFTPAGQIHRLIKGRTVGLHAKKTVDQKHLEIAVELNYYKKINQIQNGILVPESLDFNKEEAFNSWFREEIEKTKAIFKKFDVDLNIRHLEAERELLRLDRKLKQYMLTNPTCALEELKLIETFDITLINLIYTSQVYGTLLKVSKISKKGTLVEKLVVILEKFKALIRPHPEVEVEDYLKKLRLTEDISTLKPSAPTEWIIHLLKPKNV